MSGLLWGDCRKNPLLFIQVDGRALCHVLRDWGPVSLLFAPRVISQHPEHGSILCLVAFFIFETILFMWVSPPVSDLSYSCSAPSLLPPAKESSLVLRCLYDSTGFPQIIIRDISLDFSLWSVTLVISLQVLEIRTQISGVTIHSTLWGEGHRAWRSQEASCCTKITDEGAPWC